jgi:hypothetical protein
MVNSARPSDRQSLSDGLFLTPIKTSDSAFDTPAEACSNTKRTLGEARRRGQGENSMEEFAGLGDKCVMEHLPEPT